MTDTTATTDIENELSALSTPCLTEAWLDAPGIVMVCRSVALLDTDPQYRKIADFLAPQGFKITERFEDDDNPAFIMGVVRCEVWENR
jgi:hypothetical protein